MNPLHLVRLTVDAQKLYAFSRQSRLSTRDLDLGYAVHAVLAALFDHGTIGEVNAAPKPFHVVDPMQRRLEVLGYSNIDHVALSERARAFADPRAWGVCDLESIASRPVPEFRIGTKLSFSTRVCPVRRIAKRGNQKKDRAEVDAFLAEVWKLDDKTVPLDRGTVYREWLSEQVEKGGAKLLEAKLQSFQLGTQHRRTQGDERISKRVKHPEATFAGTLEVTDGAAFGARLMRGLGRHRSFGFGMLLLRPAS